TRMLVLALALAVPTLATADDKTDKTDKTMDTSAKLSDSDSKIVSHFHGVNQMEIDLGKVAQQRGTAKVKQYAMMIVRDHQKADKALTAFAKKRGMSTIPTDPTMSEADHKDMMDSAAKLKAMKGADFDREYLNMMVMGHDKELAKIDSEISGATDKDLGKLL